jgi:hypothetical protein
MGVLLPWPNHRRRRSAFEPPLSPEGVARFWEEALVSFAACIEHQDAAPVGAHPLGVQDDKTDNVSKI